MFVERAQHRGVVGGGFVGKRLVFVRPIAKHSDRRGTPLLSVRRQVLIEQLERDRIRRHAAALGFLAKPVFKIARQRKVKHHVAIVAHKAAQAQRQSLSR